MLNVLSEKKLLKWIPSFLNKIPSTFDVLIFYNTINYKILFDKMSFYSNSENFTITTNFVTQSTLYVRNFLCHFYLLSALLKPTRWAKSNQIFFSYFFSLKVIGLVLGWTRIPCPCKPTSFKHLQFNFHYINKILALN